MESVIVCLFKKLIWFCRASWPNLIKVQFQVRGGKTGAPLFLIFCLMNHWDQKEPQAQGEEGSVHWMNTNKHLEAEWCWTSGTYHTHSPKINKYGKTRWINTQGKWEKSVERTKCAVFCDNHIRWYCPVHLYHLQLLLLQIQSNNQSSCFSSNCS